VVPANGSSRPETCRDCQLMAISVGVVYIPTMKRPGHLLKVVPRWIEQGVPVRLVVAAGEFSDTMDLRSENRWNQDGLMVVRLPPSVAGIGAIRDYIIHHAERNDRRSIIMADDDVYPSRDSDFWELLRLAERPDVLGIGATRPIHDRFTGGAISANSGPILCPGGWGFNLYGLNVRNALAAGGYDPLLDADGEDAELARLGIARLKIPWMAHCDVRYGTLGRRFEQGGLNALFDEDLESRLKAQEANRALIHSRWPLYVSAPGKRYRQMWQLMLNDYIPGWKSRSAIHGGQL